MLSPWAVVSSAVRYSPRAIHPALTPAPSAGHWLVAVADMGAAGGRGRERTSRAVAGRRGRRVWARQRRADAPHRQPLPPQGRGTGAGGRWLESEGDGSATAGRRGRRKRRARGVDECERPGRWTGAQAGTARAACGKRGSCARHPWRGPWRPVFIHPGRGGSPKCGTIRRPPRRTLPAVAGGSGVGRKVGDTAQPAARRRGPRTRRRWGGGRATPVPADPATARGRWQGCRLDNNSIHIRRGARRCARGARGAEAHASKLSLVVVVHTTERHQLLVERGGRGSGRGVEEAKKGLYVEGEQ